MSWGNYRLYVGRNPRGHKRWRIAVCSLHEVHATVVFDGRFADARLEAARTADEINAQAGYFKSVSGIVLPPVDRPYDLTGIKRPDRGAPSLVEGTHGAGL